MARQSKEFKKRNGELIAALQKVADEHAITGAVADKLMMAAIVDARNSIIDLADNFDEHVEKENEMWLGIGADMKIVLSLIPRVDAVEKTDRRWTAALGVATAIGTVGGGILMLLLKALKVI